MFGLLALLIVGSPAAQTTYREKPIRMVVGFPPGSQVDIVARWNREIDHILRLSDVKERMAGAGTEPAGGSPERFREVLKRDVEKWQKVVKIAGIKPGS
jgi:tripartite-type tricarboxylate transporter receptor subunit TctC